MIVLYIVILTYFNFNIMSIVNVFMLSIEKNNNNVRLKILMFLISQKKFMKKIRKVKLKLEDVFYLKCLTAVKNVGVTSTTL